jgi:hypothetical protein
VEKFSEAVDACCLEMTGIAKVDATPKYRIKQMIQKKHGREDWLRPVLSENAAVELYITDEGIRWLKEVYYNYDLPLMEADISFEKTRIEELKSELNLRRIKYPKQYMKFKSMDVDSLMEHFQKTNSAIYKAVKVLKREGYEDLILQKDPIILGKDGVQWLEENVFLKNHLQDLITYKIELARLLEEAQ